MYPISSARTSKTRRRLETGTAPGEHPHVVAFAAANEAKAVVLNLVRPLRSGRHRLAEGRQARFDEARGTANGSERAPEHGQFNIAVERAEREST